MLSVELISENYASKSLCKIVSYQCHPLFTMAYHPLENFLIVKTSMSDFFDDQIEPLATKRDLLKASALGVGMVALGLPLVGCGGGSGSSSSPPTSFSGPPVQGLAYSSKSYSGMTGPSGQFNYAAGEVITFSVGNVVVGSLSAVPSDGKVTTYDLAGLSRSSWWNINSIVIAQFLQSLDSDIAKKKSSFLVQKVSQDGQGNSQITFDGKTISIPQSAHINLSQTPVTYLNNSNGTHIDQITLGSIVSTATNGSYKLVSISSAITNQIFYPSLA